MTGMILARAATSPYAKVSAETTIPVSMIGMWVDFPIPPWGLEQRVF